MYNELTNFELDCYIDQCIITDFVSGNECVLHLEDFSSTESEKSRIDYAGEEDFYEN